MDLTERETTIESKNGLLHRLEDKLVHFDQQFEVYDGMIKDFQEQKKLVCQKEEQIVAKQVELDWFKRLNSDKQLELDLSQDSVKRMRQHKIALEEENRYLMQVIKDSAMVKNAQMHSERVSRDISPKDKSPRDFKAPTP